MLHLEKNEQKKILLWFITSRLILCLLAYFISSTKGESLLSIFSHFDVEHYLTISTIGYNQPITTFFPIIPLIMKLFNVINLPVFGMMIINNIAIYVAAIVLYKLTESNWSYKFFLASPIAVYTFIAYTESIFLLLTLLTLYFYKNEKYLFAGLILGLSVATRSLGAMLFFSIFIILFVKWIKKKVTTKSVLEMYIPATIISLIYPIYLQIKFGNWKAFMDAQFEYWFRESSNIIHATIADFQYMKEIDSIAYYWQGFYHLTLLVGCILLCIVAGRKLLETKDEITAISILYLLATIFSVYSTCRIVSISFPTTSFYRYFYGCTSIYLLPEIFENTKAKTVLNCLILILNILLALFYAFMFYANIFLS